MENSIMSNLSTILGGSSSGSSINPSYAAIPLNELTPGPLPTFATWQWYWGGTEDNHGGYQVYDSNLNMISQTKAGSTKSNTGDVNNAANWTIYGRGRAEIMTGDENNGQGGTQGNCYWTQSNYTSNSESYSNMGTHANGQWGSSYFRFPTYTAAGNAFAKAPAQWGPYKTRTGVVICKEGVRPRYSIWQNNADIRFHIRGVTESSGGYIDRIPDISSAAYSTWGSIGSGYGQVGYNDRTRTFVLIESTTNNTNRIHVWKNLNDGRSLQSPLMGAGYARNFFLEAKAGGSTGVKVSYNYYDFTWASGGSTQQEPTYKKRVIVGDNGIIGMARFCPQGNAFEYATLNLPAATPATDSSVWLTTNAYTRMGNTTSYSIDQGDQYGINHNITWDNKVVACYAPYYYYGSGMHSFYISTEDPTREVRSQNNSSTNGCSLVPIGENSFMWRANEWNCDGGQGFRMAWFPVGNILKNLRDVDGNTVALDQAMDPSSSGSNGYMFDSYYNSTQYGAMHVMDRWIAT
jgi:hypothetical protein